VNATGAFAIRALLAVALAAASGALASAALAQEAAPADAPRRFVRVPAPDGIQIRRFNKTDGRMPKRDDRVTVHYHGTLEDGTVFDSSVQRGSPSNFDLDKVVPCWTEALTRLRVGEKAEVQCPPRTAYGLKGSPPRIPPNATLTFEIELLAIR
jgi:FKBP-type peptidyl-prolyl cis-trans isomerase FkpA